MLAGGGANSVKALGALLDKIGPAFVLVHSRSGAYGLDLIRQHADKVRAFVDVEGIHAEDRGLPDGEEFHYWQRRLGQPHEMPIGERING